MCSGHVGSLPLRVPSRPMLHGEEQEGLTSGANWGVGAGPRLGGCTYHTVIVVPGLESRPLHDDSVF